MAFHKMLKRGIKCKALREEYKQPRQAKGLLNMPVELRIHILEYVFSEDYLDLFHSRGWWLRFSAITRVSSQLRMEAQSVFYKNYSLMLQIEGHIIDTKNYALFLRSGAYERLTPLRKAYPPLSDYARGLVKRLEVQYWHLYPPTADCFLGPLKSLKEDGWSALRWLKICFKCRMDGDFNLEDYDELKLLADPYIEHVREVIEHVEVHWKLHVR